MHPTLLLQPIHKNSTDILRAFALQKPLSPAQVNFLDWHQKELSSQSFDPIIKYYIHAQHSKRHQLNASFLLPHEIINDEAIKQLKKRLIAMLMQKKSHSVIHLTQKQFLQFKQMTIHELIYWHGNQFLTGAPFFPGGIPPILFIQWGNFFGVVKFVILPGEKALKANILIYFEDMQERDLETCVHDFEHNLQQDLKLQKELVMTHETENAVESPKVKFANHFLIKHI